MCAVLLRGERACRPRDATGSLTLLLHSLYRHSRVLAQSTFGVQNVGKQPAIMFSAAPGPAGQVNLRLVREHSGALQVIHAECHSKDISTVTAEEMEWLELVGEALKLCGEEVEPVEWGGQRGTTHSVVSDWIEREQLLALSLRLTSIGF